MKVLIPAIVLFVLFIIMLFVSLGKMNGTSQKKEKSAFKQKVFLYTFASVFSAAIGIFAFTQL